MSDENNKIEDQLELTTANVEEVSTPATEVEAVSKTEEAKPLSLDDALAKAFEKHVPEEDGKPKTALPKLGTEAAPTAKPELEKQVDPITGRTLEPMKAPAGWTPALREKWSTVDPQVQKFIRDQEVGMAKKLQDVSEERKLASEFKEVVAPYEAMLRTFNISAKDHVKELMNLSHTLNTGSPQIKAQVIHNLISHFKPDFATLEQLSRGFQPDVAQKTSQPVNVEEEVQKVLSKREQEAQERQVATEIESFSTDASNEFYSDVRETMGRILNAGLVDAPTMPALLKKAYDLACSQHPEISQIIASRSTAQPSTSPQATRQIKPSLGNGNKSRLAARPISLDDAIKQAARQHGLT